MVRAARFELAISGFQNQQNTTFPYPDMVENKGIEPLLLVYQTSVLTVILILNMVEDNGIEPLRNVCKTFMLPLHQSSILWWRY